MRPATPATDLNINNSVKTTVFSLFFISYFEKNVRIFFANDQNHTNDYTTSGVIKVERKFSIASHRIANINQYSQLLLISITSSN
jgi:hypothetical protein